MFALFLLYNKSSKNCIDLNLAATKKIKHKKSNLNTSSQTRFLLLTPNSCVQVERIRYPSWCTFLFQWRLFLFETTWSVWHLKKFLLSVRDFFTAAIILKIEQQPVYVLHSFPSFLIHSIVKFYTILLYVLHQTYQQKCYDKLFNWRIFLSGN